MCGLLPIDCGSGTSSAVAGESQWGRKGIGMHRARAFGLILGLGASITVGAVVDDAAAQNCGSGGVDSLTNCIQIDLISDASGGPGSGVGGDSEGGDRSDATRGDGANGGRGGFETIHDVGNAREDASSTVVINSATTPDAISPDVNVEARLLTDPVLAIAGSFADTDVDVFAPDGSGNAQAGTTGGYGLAADAAGGDGGDGGNATGGRGGDGDAGGASLGVGGDGGLNLPILDATIVQTNVNTQVGLP
jgi:hypothetical protein